MGKVEKCGRLMGRRDPKRPRPLVLQIPPWMNEQSTPLPFALHLGNDCLELDGKLVLLSLTRKPQMLIMQRECVLGDNGGVVDMSTSPDVRTGHACTIQGSMKARLDQRDDRGYVKIIGAKFRRKRPTGRANAQIFKARRPNLLQASSS